MLAAQTGLRVSELTALTVGDLRLGTGSHVSCHGKGRKDRCTPLTTHTQQIMTVWLADHRAASDTAPLFCTRTGSPLSRDAVGRLVAKHATHAAQDHPVLHGKTITPHTLRHTAQRHADAGVPIDVLATLLDHQDWGATRRYYRIGEDRRRAAVDTVTALSFDRHGNRVWRDAEALLASEHARYAVGELAVPYGTCTEPANVQAGGGACPVRFRCAGCDHFRTTVAHLPDLQAYLDDLLRTRERLTAAVDGIDEWARVDASPTEEEITRIRQLITRIKDGLDGLDAVERAHIDDAVAVVRRHRAAHAVPLGMPTSRPATPASPTTTTAEATA